jgi:hypothetical protein
MARDGHAYREGRCRQCGWRVIADRQDSGHTRFGRWCGPVETEQPSTVPDEPPGPDTPVWGLPFAVPGTRSQR